MNQPSAIGFFDSGVGGLSVLRHALDCVGGIPLLYVADSAYAPYGGREQAQVIARSRAIARFLVEQGAQAIVVACNTATAIAIEALRAALPPEVYVWINAYRPEVETHTEQERARMLAVLADQLTGKTPDRDRIQAVVQQLDPLVRGAPGNVEVAPIAIQAIQMVGPVAVAAVQLEYPAILR